MTITTHDIIEQMQEIERVVQEEEDVSWIVVISHDWGWLRRMLFVGTCPLWFLWVQARMKWL